MNKLLSLAIMLLLVTTITGCGLLSDRQPPQDIVILNPQKANFADSMEIKKKMYLQYQQWKGTKYSMGGLSKQGVDCSGLVYAIYREQLGIELPRSTKLQSQVGKKIDRSDLRPGDLVFFKTGFKARHVGIYIENDKFLHTSTKKGVTISKLNDYYWKDRYWYSRRVGL